MNNNHILAIGALNQMEHICPTCKFHGSTSCPSSATGRDERIEDYPQVTEYLQTPVKILVYSCENYDQKPKTKIRNKKPIFVWDPIKRKHVLAK